MSKERPIVLVEFEPGEKGYLSQEIGIWLLIAAIFVGLPLGAVAIVLHLAGVL